MAIIEVLSVRRTVLPAAPQQPIARGPAMTITPEAGGSSLAIPYAPRDVDHTNLTADYASIERPGLSENIVYSKPQRPQMQFDLTVADKKVVATTANGSQTLVRALSVIQALQAMGRKGTRVRIAYGSLESGLWFMTEMSVKTSNRDPSTQEITSAVVSMTLKRGDDSLSGIGTGPVTGGVSTTTKPPAPVPTKTTTPAPTKKPSQPASRTYKTKSGDTLWAISVRFYGTGTKWKVIGDANGIKDPRKLPVGKTLRIP